MLNALLPSGIRVHLVSVSVRSILTSQFGSSTTALSGLTHGALKAAYRAIEVPNVPCGSLRSAFRQFSAEAGPKSPKAGGHVAPVSMRTLLLTMMAGAGIIAGVKTYSDSKLQTVMRNSQQVVGKASVGGPFDLIDTGGKRFTDKDLHGEFALLYFGFTHCPDICPDEMEKVAEVVDSVEKQVGIKVPPVFISIDPQRDTPKLVKKYVAEFHPRMIGLTGDFENVKRASKAYRVYFNKTGDSETDYLVDHSIIHYLIDPTGEFVTFYGKNFTAEALAESVVTNIVAWKKEHPDTYHKGVDIKAPALAAK